MGGFNSHTLPPKKLLTCVKLKRFLIKPLIPLLLFLLVLNIPLTYALISLRQEKEIGRVILKELTSQVNFIQDVELVAYINTVGNILKTKGLSFSPFNFKFFLIKNDTFNAFSVPGGYIFLNSGIFDSIKSEDELAGIMAHEMAHNICRHVAKKLEKVNKFQLATIAATIAALILGGPKVGEAVGMTSIAWSQTKLLAYSRAEEEEADKVGLQIMAKAGYNPWGMVEIMERLSKQSNFAIELNYRYLLDHPLPPERLNYLMIMAEKYTHNKTPANIVCHEETYFKRLCIKAQVLSKDPSDLVIEYREELENKKDPWKIYALALALSQERFFKSAIKEMKEAIKVLPKRPYFLIDLAEIYFNSGNYEKALSILNKINLPKKFKYLNEKLYTLKLKYLKARIFADIGDKYEAYKLFSRLKRTGLLDTNPYFYFYFGKTAFEIKRLGEAHFYFGKYFELKGDYKTAIYHYKKALSFLSKTDKMYREVQRSIESIE